MTKKFKIYTHPQGFYKAVKEGFSWPAFLFGAFWALFHKMWRLGFGLIGSLALASVILALIVPEKEQDKVDGFFNIVGAVIAFQFGANGNKWREEHLISRGFELQTTILAENIESAISLYIKENQK